MIFTINANLAKRLPLLLVALPFLLVPHYGQSAPQDGAQKEKIIFGARPFPLQQVRLLNGPLEEAMERDRQYLHGLEIDRLLHNFRVNAGLPSSAEPLGGWEAPNVELRGHFVGHFLTACALMYASSGNNELKAKADTVVAELAKCQQAFGNGFLSAFPESFIDRVETGKKVWAPWYTLHKIFAGMLDMYALCDNAQALEVVEKMAAWAKSRTDRLNEAQMQQMLKVEFGGMSEVLYNLYAVTGDPNHLALAQRFEHRAFLDPLANHRDELKGIHANTQIPKVIGAARAYELTGDKRYQEIATFFWDEVTASRAYATGGTSYDELWAGDPFHLSNQLGPYTHETCCTYNLLRLTRRLFMWNPDPHYADYYERAFYNGILSTQHPQNGMTTYYVPMAAGWYKTFCSPRASFWCCTGTGVESFGKLGNSIYFHDDEGVFINLFIASELSWPEKGIRIRQETSFPEQPSTRLLIQCKKPVELAIHVRVPYWIERGGSVKINGKPQDIFASPSSYLTLRRIWKNGDKIDLALPMGLRLDRMPDNPNRAAILYGPIVLAGELGAEGLDEKNILGQYGPSGDPVFSPFFVVKNGDPKTWIQQAPDEPLTFRTVGAGQPEEVTLMPFYKLFDQRYALYWDIYTESEWASMKTGSAAFPFGIIDSVRIGDKASERAHNFVSYFYQDSTVKFGADHGRNWITTSDWFKYDLRVLPDQPVILQCTYASADTAKEFEIRFDGMKAHVPAIAKTSGELVAADYAIPPELTRGRKRIEVLFRVERGQTSRKLFGCAMLKAKVR